MFKDKRFKRQRGSQTHFGLLSPAKPARAIVNNQSLDLVLFTHLVREGHLILDDGEDPNWDLEERNF